MVDMKSQSTHCKFVPKQAAMIQLLSSQVHFVIIFVEEGGFLYIWLILRYLVRTYFLTYAC
jgi:hypothetical protein